jgi:3-oxoacyl-[acyl-carrier-protein] synthase III
MLQAYIKAIEYHLPDTVLDNEQLAQVFPDWSATKIKQKTGIAERRIARHDELSSDLGVQAANKLFASGVCKPEDIDFLLFCTQTPDYFLPTTACILQDRLGLPTGCGALDFNLGCSAFVYGLSMAKGLIETRAARNVLLITSETYSKLMHNMDKSVRTLFGDGASAALLTHKDLQDSDQTSNLGPFVFGTDGSGAENLIVPAGGMRLPHSEKTKQLFTDEQGSSRTLENLYMNGAEVFTFSLRRVPEAVTQLLEKAQLSINDVDLFVFHQANQYMLEHLRRKIGIEKQKFYISLEDCGNTVSATIPIALKRAANEGVLKKGDKVMIVGFGVGYSWAASILTWF